MQFVLLGIMPMMIVARAEAALISLAIAGTALAIGLAPGAFRP